MLAPNPLPKCSANLHGSPPLSYNHRPNIGLQHSSLCHMALELSLCCPATKDSSTSVVPTFQPGGRFVGGISCGLSCQRGTITAAKQSPAVTGGHRARSVAPIICLAQGCHFKLPAHWEANYICVQFFIEFGKHFILVIE